MPLPEPQYGARSVHQAGLGLCLALLAALTGCQNLSSTSSLARLRVVDLSADAGIVDVYHGSTAVAYNLSYGTVTSYVPLSPGSYAITIDTAGSKQTLSSVKGSFAAGGQYTMLVTNPLAGAQSVILPDQVPPAVAAGPSIRLVHQALRTGPVDVYLVPAGQRFASVAAIVTNLAPGASTGYLAAPAGVCTVVLMPAGIVPAAGEGAVHIGTQVDYVAGSARSLILLDRPSSLPPGVQVITTVDAELTN